MLVTIRLPKEREDQSQAKKAPKEQEVNPEVKVWVRPKMWKGDPRVEKSQVLKERSK